MKLLLKIQEVTKNRFEDLVQAMSLEMGAPITMSRNAQADAAIGHLDGFIEALKNLNLGGVSFHFFICHNPTNSGQCNELFAKL